MPPIPELKLAGYLSTVGFVTAFRTVLTNFRAGIVLYIESCELIDIFLKKG